jgi:excisionase family DNA binding protein
MTKMFSVREVAQLLGICEATVYRATWRGDLQGHRDGKRIRFTQSMLDSWIDQNSATPRKMPRKSLQGETA